jgi:hypothetical protein
MQGESLRTVGAMLLVGASSGVHFRLMSGTAWLEALYRGLQRVLCMLSYSGRCA